MDGGNRREVANSRSRLNDIRVYAEEVEDKGQWADRVVISIDNNILPGNTIHRKTISFRRQEFMPANKILTDIFENVFLLKLQYRQLFVVLYFKELFEKNYLVWIMGNKGFALL